MFREHSSSPRFPLLRLFEGGRRGIELLTLAVEYERNEEKGRTLTDAEGKFLFQGTCS